MSKPKTIPYRWVMVTLALLAPVVGLWLSTQYFAAKFDYHPALGEHYQHLYYPWLIISWYIQHRADFPAELNAALTIGTSCTSFIMLCLLAGWFMLINSSKANPSLYGTARWATIEDIKQTGLFIDPPIKNPIKPLIPDPARSERVYVGGIEIKGVKHLISHGGPEHILTYAPTRSGKGLGLVLPTLLEWGKSCVITDLKGELWELTAGWRKQYANNKTLRFEPASSIDSVKWNPLDEIRIGTDYEVSDVQNLVTLIVDPDGKGLNDHWAKTAYALLVGVILHALYQAKAVSEAFPELPKKRATLASVDQMLADPNREIKHLWNDMLKAQYMPNPEASDNPEAPLMIAHPVAAAAAKDMIDRPSEEAGSVLSTAKSFLALYRDPIVARNTNSSEFSIKELMNHDLPVSLYIVTTPDDKDRLRPLVRILISMILRKLTGKMQFQDGKPLANYKHRLLMMLDEFPSLGKLDIMQESLAFVAGYGIKCYLICQDLNQLKSREIGYGQDESITSNCHIQNAYPPNRIETAEHLSRLLGQTTIVKEQITTSGRRSAAMHSQVSRTLQETQRALLTPDEVKNLPGPQKNAQGLITKAGEMLIYAAGFPPIRGKQLLYFEDDIFKQRIKVKAPQTTDKLM